MLASGRPTAKHMRLTLLPSFTVISLDMLVILAGTEGKKRIMIDVLLRLINDTIAMRLTLPHDLSSDEVKYSLWVWDSIRLKLAEKYDNIQACLVVFYMTNFFLFFFVFLPMSFAKVLISQTPLLFGIYTKVLFG